jgi:hypothetical protein
MSGLLNVNPIKTNFHLNYSRVFFTPYNENLIVASFAGRSVAMVLIQCLWRTRCAAFGMGCSPATRSQLFE